MNYELLSKSFNKYPKRDLLSLNRLSKEYGLPFDILCGIYLIETTFRPYYYRCGEYIVVLFNLFLALLFNKPIKNYTIGKCQIGMGTILCYFGYKNAYFYSKEISDVTIEQAIVIVKSFFWEYNSRIFAWRLRIIYHNSSPHNTNYSKLIRTIGYTFNGKIGYCLILEELVNRINLTPSQHEDYPLLSVINRVKQGL